MQRDRENAKKVLKGRDEHRKKTHWADWVRSCKPKYSGGMSFRNLRKFNEALLAMQVWRLMQNKQSLVFKVLSTGSSRM